MLTFLGYQVQAVTIEHGGAVKYPETVVYREDAILPHVVIIYTRQKKDKAKKGLVKKGGGKKSTGKKGRKTGILRVLRRLFC